MSTIFGLAGLSAADYQTVAAAGEELIYSATQVYLNRVNQDVDRAISIFVESDTENYTEKYQLPGSGTRLPRRATGLHAPALTPTGSWSVGYPLEDFGGVVAVDDVEWAYMPPAEYQRNVDTVVIAYKDQVRHQILHRLMDNQGGSAVTFADPRWGNISVQPLANGDSVTYPPVLGSSSEATEDHYLESGYAAASISTTNNPLVTIRDDLNHHFGRQTGNENIAVFINRAERDNIEGLAGFSEVEDRFIMSGDNVDLPSSMPMNAPGVVIGRGYGVWVIEWDWIPANYMLGIHLDAPKPLKRRVDPSYTGLPRGLAMVASDDTYPIRTAEWRARFGFGVANRLNGVSFELGTGGTYTVPTAYDSN